MAEKLNPPTRNHKKSQETPQIPNQKPTTAPLLLSISGNICSVSTSCCSSLLGRAASTATTGISRFTRLWQLCSPLSVTDAQKQPGPVNSVHKTASKKTGLEAEKHGKNPWKILSLRRLCFFKVVENPHFQVAWLLFCKDKDQSKLNLRTCLGGLPFSTGGKGMLSGKSSGGSTLQITYTSSKGFQRHVTTIDSHRMSMAK